MTNTEIDNRIEELVHDEKHREVLKRRFIDGLCYDQLADEFDYSVRQIQRIVKKYETKILKGIA